MAITSHFLMFTTLSNRVSSKIYGVCRQFAGGLVVCRCAGRSVILMAITSHFLMFTTLSNRVSSKIYGVCRQFAGGLVVVVVQVGQSY